MNESRDRIGTAGVDTDTPASPASTSTVGGWRESRWLAWCELALVALIFIADWTHFIPFSKTPFLLLLGWASLWLRKIGWRDIGLRRYRSWAATFGVGLALGVLLEAFFLFVGYPVLSWLTGRPANLEDFRPLIGNFKLLVLALAGAWALAGFGEEMVYRGYLLNRVADLGGRTRRAWIASLVLVSVGFGLAHTYQGVTGVIEAGLDGALVALMYFGTGRNLSIPIFVHGFTDTAELILIYLGRYPGM